MKKVYRIEVDCPTCASKLEECVKATDGVEKCSVNLMTQKLSIFAENDLHDQIISSVIERMKKIDDDVVIYR